MKGIFLSFSCFLAIQMCALESEQQFKEAHMPSEVVSQISDEKQRQILQEQYALIYKIFAESKLVSNAAFKGTETAWRCLSGIQSPFSNAVLGVPEGVDFDTYIDKQLAYFKEAKVPFVWYLDEESNSEFRKKLLDKGFHNLGVFQGVIGVLDESILNSKVSEEYVLEFVRTPKGMDEFNELVCSTFEIRGTSKDMYKKMLWDMAKTDSPKMFHWVARKKGKVVSTLSTFIDGEIVSFWNGASLLEVRRQGVNTALRHLALKDAISRGCIRGSSYLMFEGLAYGLCNKLGYETKWQFNAFIAPSDESLL